MYKEFMHEEIAGGYDDNYIEYSWPINLFWNSMRLTVLQMFTMAGSTILGFEHSHSFSDIGYVFTGSGSCVFSNGENLRLEKGVVFYINAKVPHRVVPDPGTDLQIFNLSLIAAPLETSDKIPSHIIDEELDIFRRLVEREWLSASGCYNLEDFIRNAINFQRYVKPGNFIKFKNCVSNFLISAFQELTLPKAQPVKYSATDESMMLNMRRIIIYMRDHFAEGLTLQDLAAALNYSPRHCQRLIQEYLGVGFSDYILAHQIRQAKRLLRASSATLEEIAEQSGFSSAKTLTQRFKALTGMTPFQYRKEHAGDYSDDL